MAKPHCYPAKTGYGCPPPCPPETDECPNHPDLYLLRDAAADERGAIADYGLARPKLAWMRFSWMLPKMRWSTMRKRCGLFPGLIRSGNAEMLAEEALDVLVMKRPIAEMGCTKKAPEAADVAVPPGKKDLPAVHHQGHTR